MAIMQRSQDMAAEFCQFEDYPRTIVYIKDIKQVAHYHHDAGYFKPFDNEAFDQFVYKWLLGRWQKNLSTSIAEDIAQQIQWLLPRIIPNMQSNYIALTDKLLNLKTFEYEPFAVEKTTFYKLNVSSVAIEANRGKGLRFQEFLDYVLVSPETLEADKQLQSFVQEIFGYCLLPTLEKHSAFFFLGEGSNGKSVLLSVLGEIMGKEFVTAFSVEKLTTDRWAKSHLPGKRVNICTEEESQFVKSDAFKALVSGDIINAEYKYGNNFEFQPTLKFVFATNEMPTFNGFNHGLVRRIKIIPFNRIIPDALQDTKILGKLLSELPAIVAWAIDGAKRLVENGFRFTEAAQTELKSAEFRETLSTAVAFIKTQYIEDAEDFTPFTDLYTAYRAWCEQNGCKVMKSRNFAKDINRELKLPPKLGRDDGGNTCRGRAVRVKPT